MKIINTILLVIFLFTMNSYAADVKFKALSLSPYHNSFLIDSDGKLWGSGRNEYCELADTFEKCQNDVITITKTKQGDVAQVANGNFHTVLLLKNGKVLVAGNRTRGQIGVAKGTNVDNFSTPEFDSDKIPSIKKIAAGHYGTYLIDDKGKLWGTGYYANGQLTFDDAKKPNSNISKFTKIPTPKDVKFVEISYGYDQVLAIDSKGNIWATGGNRDGQAGVGADTSQDIFGLKNLDAGKVKFIAISAGGAGGGNGTDAYNGARHSLALDSDGNIWSAGNNSRGQLGTGDFISINKFTKVTSGVKFKKITAGGSFSIALTNSGEIYATGNNIDYTLGIGEVELVNSFQPVLSHDLKFIDIAAGAKHIEAIDENGNRWVAGANEYGQLGLGLPIGSNHVAKYLTNNNFSNKIKSIKLDNVVNPQVKNLKPKGDTLRIGFIGNSLTFTNDVPQRLKDIANANGKSIDVKYQAISGDSLINQFNYRDFAAHRIISYFNPDYVFLQEKTNGTDIEPLGLWSAFAQIHNIEPIIYQVWYQGKNCLASNKIADKLGLRVAPVGHAFQEFIRGNGYTCTEDNQTDAINKDIVLTKPNDYHPNMQGSYMSALVLYMTIYGVDKNIKMPSGADSKLWDKMVTTAIGAINYNKDGKGELRSKRPAIVRASKTSKTKLEFKNFSAYEIPINVGSESRLNITLSGGPFYIFMQEANGRIIGKAYPKESDFILNESFYANGDRIINGIPYEDMKLPKGDYTLTIISATADKVSTVLKIN